MLLIPSFLICGSRMTIDPLTLQDYWGKRIKPENVQTVSATVPGCNVFINDHDDGLRRVDTQ